MTPQLGIAGHLLCYKKCFHLNIYLRTLIWLLLFSLKSSYATNETSFLSELIFFSGSSNSQDSFPSGGGSGSLDGYGYGYPSSDYGNQRPPSQSNQGKILSYSSHIKALKICFYIHYSYF